MPQILPTTHVLIQNALVVFRRPRSSIWQCRYKVGGVWQRATTKEADLSAATAKAHALKTRAEIRLEDNLPVITRKFRNIALLAIQRMETDTANGVGKTSYTDYARIIKDYLIPFFGNYVVTTINHSVLVLFDKWRTDKMLKVPANSTLLMHNAALNRVFDEAIMRNFLTDANRPKLEAKGKIGDVRPAFSMAEIHAVRHNFDAWIENARGKKNKEIRALLRDYVEILLNTGARPGVELVNLKWNQIEFLYKPVITVTDELDEDEEHFETDGPQNIVNANLNRSCFMVVSGKTKMRTIVGMQETVKALERIIARNYDDVKNPYLNPFAGIAIPSNNDYVLRTKGKVDVSNSFQKMFDRYLDEHSLLIDAKTGQKRVLYSLRHTYATFSLTHNKVPIHTLTKQMGTSIKMIEKHYSHLKVVQAIEQLRNDETKKLINAGGVIDATYTSTKIAK